MSLTFNMWCQVNQMDGWWWDSKVTVLDWTWTVGYQTSLTHEGEHGMFSKQHYLVFFSNMAVVISAELLNLLANFPTLKKLANGMLFGLVWLNKCRDQLVWKVELVTCLKRENLGIFFSTAAIGIRKMLHICYFSIISLWQKKGLSHVPCVVYM